MLAIVQGLFECLSPQSCVSKSFSPPIIMHYHPHRRVLRFMLFLDFNCCMWITMY